MRQSQLFTKTRKLPPSDEVSKNAQLLIRAGFINKEMAGVYTFLPLGLRVLNNINKIIREEMNKIGGQEILLSALQEKNTWEKTDRWSEQNVDVWFKTKLLNDTELGLAFTHEEPITKMMREHISSYRDLPKYVYQIQTKFRNEVRAKSGIMRTREFPMKDLYSFNIDQNGLNEFYETVGEAYMRIFTRVGIGDVTYKTFASGGSFSKYSHEYQTASEAGEDIIYIDKDKKIAVNEEVYTDEVLSDLELKKETLQKEKAIEVGNIFKLGTKFSEALNLTYKNKDGELKYVIMGSYGIGPTRLMGTIAEVLSDDKGLVWNRETAPFDVHLVRLGEDNDVVLNADTLYETLTKKNVHVLYDDRNATAGEKFADSDLIGIPIRVIVSKNTLKENSYEVVERKNGKKEMQTHEELISELTKN